MLCISSMQSFRRANTQVQRGQLSKQTLTLNFMDLLFDTRLQVPGIARIDANDMDRNATESMRRNVAFNGEEASNRVHVVCHDVRHLMMQSNKVQPKPILRLLVYHGHRPESLAKPIADQLEHQCQVSP